MMIPVNIKQSFHKFKAWIARQIVRERYVRDGFWSHEIDMVFVAANTPISSYWPKVCSDDLYVAGCVLNMLINWIGLVSSGNMLMSYVFLLLNMSISMFMIVMYLLMKAQNHYNDKVFRRLNNIMEFDRKAAYNNREFAYQIDADPHSRVFDRLVHQEIRDVACNGHVVAEEYEYENQILLSFTEIADALTVGDDEPS